MLGRDPDLVVHLGDYIYEGPMREHRRSGAHNSAGDRHRCPTTATGTRFTRPIRRSRRCTRTARGSSPGTTTKSTTTTPTISPEDKQTREAFLERRANAYQAYYEHMPLRISSLPHGSKMQIYRRVPYGDLAEFAVLDTRQYRTDQPCGDGTKAACDGVFDPKAHDPGR